jgi:hypothetical protein
VPRAIIPADPPCTAYTESVHGQAYHKPTFFTQSHDLATTKPAKLEELKKVFLEVAKKNDVLPLDDRGPQHAIGARPSILGDRKTITFGAGASRMPED